MAFENLIQNQQTSLVVGTPRAHTIRQDIGRAISRFGKPMRLGIVPRRQRRTELKTTRYRFNALVVQDTTKKWSFNRVQRTGEGTVIDPPSRGIRKLKG